MIAHKTSKDAKLLFVGINPHPGSYRRGVPFSNNKMFWYLLNRAGLLREAEKDLRNDQSLKAIYGKQFMSEYGLNFVNLVDRPTIDVTMLKKGEEEVGIKRALKIICNCKPRVVCFIGKIAFDTFYRTRECDWGWQTEIDVRGVLLWNAWGQVEAARQLVAESGLFTSENLRGRLPTDAKSAKGDANESMAYDIAPASS